MTFADSYFQKCHQLMNKNSKLKRRIMQLELEIMDLKKENEQLKAVNQYLIELLEHTGATVEIEKVKMNDR